MREGGCELNLENYILFDVTLFHMHKEQPHFNTFRRFKNVCLRIKHRHNLRSGIWDMQKNQAFPNV